MCWLFEVVKRLVDHIFQYSSNTSSRGQMQEDIGSRHLNSVTKLPKLNQSNMNT